MCVLLTSFCLCWTKLWTCRVTRLVYDPLDVCPLPSLELVDICRRTDRTGAFIWLLSVDKVQGVTRRQYQPVSPSFGCLSESPMRRGWVLRTCWSVSRCGGVTVTLSPWISGTALSLRCPMRSTATTAVWRSCSWTPTSWESCLR